MKKLLGIVTAALLISCGKKFIAPLQAPPPQPALQAIEAPEPAYAVTEDEETGEETTEENDILRRIIIPYAKEYLAPGQETRIMVHLENADYGDEMHFTFSAEPGKNCIEVDAFYNAAIIKAVKEGEQYIVVSHPKAPQSRVIVYDVLPPSPPPPPEIDVSESPMIVRKGETKPLRLILLNGNGADREKFRFQVVENAYAIEVRQQGNMLNVTGIAPGAGKIRITNTAAMRDYDVMVIVD
ncbi:MAG: hypothetical protein LBB89_01665 [Treponema sp.]|jgi:hypothetical protein|nr:hypothetical protein [Treponema sp.]